VVVVKAHRQSPWTLDWVCGDVIGRRQGLFPDFAPRAKKAGAGAMTIP
jgi:hypothetical protein